MNASRNIFEFSPSYFIKFTFWHNANLFVLGRPISVSVYGFYLEGQFVRVEVEVMLRLRVRVNVSLTIRVRVQVGVSV